MKFYVVLLITLIHSLIFSINAYGSETNELSGEPNTADFERRYKVADGESYEASDDDNGEDSSELAPSDIHSYLVGRSLKKGFNSWAGRRALFTNTYEHDQPDLHGSKRGFNAWAGKRHLYQVPNKTFLKLRQRRRPWGGAANN